MHDISQLVERLVDEDDRHETGETLLGEACDVTHQETELERHNNQQGNHHPETDPETKWNERQIVVPAPDKQHRTTHTVTNQWVSQSIKILSGLRSKDYR